MGENVVEYVRGVENRKAAECPVTQPYKRRRRQAYSIFSASALCKTSVSLEGRSNAA